MKRFGLKMGGKSDTFSGLAGIGDLEVTCNSLFSRNFQAGYSIGKANSAEEFLKNNKNIVEGINTAQVITEMAKELKVEMPICEIVNDIMTNKIKPTEAYDQLMKRDLKNEKE